MNAFFCRDLRYHMFKCLSCAYSKVLDHESYLQDFGSSIILLLRMFRIFSIRFRFGPYRNAALNI
jgi:hypothetical protein